MLTGIFEALTVIGAGLGMVIIGLALASGPSDVSIAAAASLGLACAGIPYVIAGVFHRHDLRQILIEANRQRIGED